MSALQHYFDIFSALERGKRQAAQQTLGSLIEQLKCCAAEAQILMDDAPCALSNPHSYRGYYADLALEPSGAAQRVDELLALLRDCLGETYRGYKGGDYVMESNAPLWIAHWSCEGSRLLRVEVRDGAVCLISEVESDG
jgi:hypothetical protein